MDHLRPPILNDELPNRALQHHVYVGMLEQRRPFTSDEPQEDSSGLLHLKA